MELSNRQVITLFPSYLFIGKIPDLALCDIWAEAGRAHARDVLFRDEHAQYGKVLGRAQQGCHGDVAELPAARRRTPLLCKSDENRTVIAFNVMIRRLISTAMARLELK